MDDLETEIKELIVDALMLEGVTPQEIAADEPLFVEGLGLDSIDALELGVAIRKKFGIKIEAVNDVIKSHFYSVRSLAKYIDSQRNETN
jgi:acyl carrier protein